MDTTTKVFIITRDDASEDVFRVWDAEPQKLSGRWNFMFLVYTRKMLTYLGISDELLDRCNVMPQCVELSIE